MPHAVHPDRTGRKPRTRPSPLQDLKLFPKCKIRSSRSQREQNDWIVRTSNGPSWRIRLPISHRDKRNRETASCCRLSDSSIFDAAQSIRSELAQCLHAVDAECLRSVFLRIIQFQHIIIAIQPLMSERRPSCALVHFPGLNSRAIAGSLGNIVMLTVNGERDALMNHRKAEFVYIAFYLRFT
jgi:hypothetical protein